ncbi:hypothetical protein ACH4XT_37060 [Streptomyces avidinii]|uniref:hypothetical protein n=1 Tax=Streptomyces avidinii TaxID=1895 RepID=UPI00378A1289
MSLPGPARRHVDRTAHLNVDRHSAHRSKVVRAWLADHEEQRQPHIVRAYFGGRHVRYVTAE